MKRVKNVGETPGEQTYIRVSHLTRLRCIFTLLLEVTPRTDPVNIPREEYDRVVQTLDRWMQRLEATEKERGEAQG